MASPRSTWWQVTAYGDNMVRCEGALPDFIKEIRGGREECPTTKRLHFQGAIRCQTQVRRSKVLEWLPGCHVEAAESVFATTKYAMKKETAAGEKTIRTNSVRHYAAHEICMLLARQTDSSSEQRRLWLETKDDDGDYWYRVNLILDQTPELAGQLMNPSLRGFFRRTKLVWMKKARDPMDEPGEVHSITLPKADEEIEHVSEAASLFVEEFCEHGYEYGICGICP